MNTGNSLIDLEGSDTYYSVQMSLCEYILQSDLLIPSRPMQGVYLSILKFLNDIQRALPK